MNKLFSRLLSKCLSEGEVSAFKRLFSEFAISRNHRRGLAKLSRESWSRPPKLHLGSGRNQKDGYLNVDMFPGGDLTLDLRRDLPFDSDCCDTIISEHCVEHFDYPEPAGNLFRECLRILRPNGLFRFSVPDTEWPLNDYSKGKDSDYFRACAENAWWHPSRCTTRLEHINYHFRQGHEHLFAYDEETAINALSAAGFVEVKRMDFDPTFDSEHRRLGSLIMAARKPASKTTP